jgi:hypothetical protein
MSWNRNLRPAEDRAHLARYDFEKVGVVLLRFPSERVECPEPECGRYTARLLRCLGLKSDFKRAS